MAEGKVGAGDEAVVQCEGSCSYLSLTLSRERAAGSGERGQSKQSLGTKSTDLGGQ